MVCVFWCSGLVFVGSGLRNSVLACVGLAPASLLACSGMGMRDKGGGVNIQGEGSV